MTSAIAMFGLGDIGLPIAARLSASFDLVGYDPRFAAGANPSGVRTEANWQEAISYAETAVLCLPNPAVSRAVVADICGASGSPIRLIIDVSTVGPTTCASNADVAAGAAIGYLDAPISGSPTKAAAGELTVMAAGASHAFENAEPVLRAIATHVFVVGDRPGLGQAMKLANNIINATAMAVTCEAVAFGTRMGLDMAQMIDVLNVSTGRTSASTEKFPRSIVPGTFDFGARGEIVHKDAALFLDAANAAGLETTVATASEQLWDAHTRANPSADVTRIYNYVDNYVDDPQGHADAK